MVLSGPMERTLTARTNEKPKRRKTSLPPSRMNLDHKRIERMKGVRYLGRKREKPAPWRYAR
jgi:hypothetical protein